MKRKLLKNLFCFTVCSSMIMGLFSRSYFETYAVSEETQKKIDEAEEEKEQLENELEEQEQKKEHLEDSKKSEEEKLKSLKQQYRALSSDLEALDQERTEKETEISEKEAELRQALRQQEEQYENMKLRIRYLYETPEESLFAMLLKDFDIGRILNRIDNTIRIQKYDREQLEEYETNTKEIEEQKQYLETAKAELETLIGKTEEKQAQVSDLQKQTGKSIEQYLQQIADTEDQIDDTEDALEAKSEALQKLYEQAQEEEAAEQRRQAEEAAKKLQEAIANGLIKPEDSGIVYGELNLTQTELDMLTAMIYCESRGESYEGQLAVGYVITNRIRSTKFTNDLESVLRQNKQFEPAGSGRFDIVLTAYWQQIPGIIGQSEWDSCRKAALECVNGESNVGECLFFRTHAPVPQLAENLESAGVPYWIIGNHIFYYSWVNY